MEDGAGALEHQLEDGSLEFFEAILKEMKIKPEQAAEYAKSLVSQGYDSELFTEEPLDSLGEHFGFVRGDVKRVEKYRLQLESSSPTVSPVHTSDGLGLPLQEANSPGIGSEGRRYGSSAGMSLPDVAREISTKLGLSADEPMAEITKKAREFLGMDSVDPVNVPLMQNLREVADQLGIQTGWGTQMPGAPASTSSAEDWASIIRKTHCTAEERREKLQDIAESWQSGRWKIGKELGHGGTGVVYECSDSRLSAVAIKFSFGDRRKLVREAALMQRVSHDNIVKLHNYYLVEDGGLCGMVMELLDQGTLEHMLHQASEHRLREFEVAQVGFHCLNALIFMHQKDVIHRDIKPDNIMVAYVEGALTFKLIDLSIAAVEAEARDDLSETMKTSTTSLAALIGTAHYMSPEQFEEGKSVTAQTDLWSLGAVMFEALSGVKPFAHGERNRTKICHAISGTPTPSLDDVVKDVGAVSEVMASCIYRALEKECADRFQTSVDMRDALDLAMRFQGDERFGCFISYRVWCDKEFAEALFKAASTCQLRSKQRMKVYLDKVRLLDGQRYDIGFMKGLASSIVFTPLISKNGTKSFLNLAEQDQVDNVLLEWVVAIELHNQGIIKAILPIVIGEQDSEDGHYSRAFFDDLRGGMINSQPLPDVVSKQTSAKAREFLGNLDTPVELTEELTVKQIVESMLKFQAIMLHRFKKDELMSTDKTHGKTVQLIARDIVVATCAERIAKVVVQHEPAIPEAVPPFAAGHAPEPINAPGHWDAMISYTQRNAKAELLAEAVYSSMRERGKAVWLDVKMNQLNEAAMREAAQCSKCIIAIVTGAHARPNPEDGEQPEDNAYFKRDYCVNELRWAREAGIPIQPVVLPDDKSRIGQLLGLAPADLKDLGKVDFIHLDRSRTSYWNAGIDDVLDSVDRLVASQSLGGVMPRYAHIAPDRSRENFSAEDNALIAAAAERGELSVRLNDVRLSDSTILRFEVRFGTYARSRRMPHGSPTGMCQVNLDNDNTRVVEEVSPAPAAAVLQPAVAASGDFPTGVPTMMLPVSSSSSAPPEGDLMALFSPSLRESAVGGPSTHQRKPGEYRSGDIVDIDTEDGFELAALVLGLPEGGDSTEMRVKFADGTVDDWPTADFSNVRTQEEERQRKIAVLEKKAADLEEATAAAAAAAGGTDDGEDALAMRLSMATMVEDDRRREEKRRLATEGAIAMGFAPDLVASVQAEGQFDMVDALVEKIAELTRGEQPEQVQALTLLQFLMTVHMEAYHDGISVMGATTLEDLLTLNEQALVAQPVGMRPLEVRRMKRFANEHLQKLQPPPPQQAEVDGYRSPKPASNIRTVAVERVVRAGFERDSKKVGKLKVGERIKILESRPEDEGGSNKNRVRVDQGPNGIQGWVSDSSSTEGLAFEEDIASALEQRLEAWLAGPAGGGVSQSYDTRDLLRFAKTWKLEKMTPEEIYKKYVDHNVEDSRDWVDPISGPGEVAFDISKYQKKGVMSKMGGKLSGRKQRGREGNSMDAARWMAAESAGAVPSAPAPEPEPGFVFADATSPRADGGVDGTGVFDFISPTNGMGNGGSTLSWAPAALFNTSLGLASTMQDTVSSAPDPFMLAGSKTNAHTDAQARGEVASHGLQFGEETRLDASDGMRYTKASFLEVYGGTQEWDAAGR